jgi:uncharacterized protein (TIRG00374 family)
MAFNPPDGRTEQLPRTSRAPLEGRSQRYFPVLSLVVAVVVVGLLLATADPRQVWQTLKSVDRAPAQAVVLLNLPALALLIARSILVLRRMGAPVALRVVVPASVLGNVAGALTPAASGELLRAAALQRGGELTFQAGLSLVAYERLLSSYLLAITTLVCLALSSLPVTVGITVAFLGAGCALLPWLVARFIAPTLPSATSVGGQGIVQRALGYLLGMANQVWSLLKDLRLTVYWSALTLATFAIVALQFRLAASSASADLSFVDAWAAFGVSAFAGILSLLPFGIGIGDGSTAAFLNVTGIPLEQATAIALLIRALVTLPLVIIAAGCYVFLTRSVPDERATPSRELPEI